jgi:hypothetical protein
MRKELDSWLVTWLASLGKEEIIQKTRYRVKKAKGKIEKVYTNKTVFVSKISEKE